ncbi:DUF4913 domain-containing protein [Streptomyces rimosus]|uniref:DUF4913 domain-containing protein n=1 Tax=Streptomyces rimosus TaxID=1927 RepID=UPI0006B27CA4|nr:DUF4913 domain-containing protein [Streptomyces rimosus]
MPESIGPRDEGDTEPVRLPDGNLEHLDATVRQLLDQSAEQARQLDNLASAPAGSPFAGFPPGPAMPAPAPAPRPILELEGEEFESEVDTLTDWVETFLMDTYGDEVSTAAPWCLQWQEHEDVLAWLHALWLAYHQHKEPDAGLAGMAVWHRDFLTHTMAAVRAPGGSLSACMTDPDRPAHRILPGPQRSARRTGASTPDTGEALA